MKKKGRLLIALAIVIVMTLSIVLMACDDTGFKVTFVTNEGTAVAELTNCKTIETEPTTSRAGYTFKGWYTNAELSGNRVTFPFTVTADTTLYASWEKNADEPDPEEPDVPKFTSAGQVFNTAATMLYSTLTDVIGSLNSKTLGYDINAVLGLNGTKHHLDISTAINLENVGVGALVNYESVTGEVSNKEIMVQVHDGAVYYKNGDQAVKMPFLGIDSLLALVVGEGIDISAITGAWDSVESYIGILGGVLFNEAFTYDKATNSATISVSNDILAGKLDTIFGLLPGNLNVQKIIDELAYNSLGIPYEINLQELVSAFNFNLELTLDLTEEDALENFGVVLTLGESNLEFKKLASCPTYDAEGNRTVVYERKEPVGEATEGEIITRELKIPANEISFDIAVNDRTTEIAAPEGEYDAVNLINFDMTGKVFLRDTDPVKDGQASDYYMDLLVKSNIDITKLITIVNGKIVPNTAGFAEAGYFRINLTAPEQTVQSNEQIGVMTEIVYDPANSGDTNIYIYLRLLGNTKFTATVNINDLVDYIISNQKPVVTPTEPEVQALANSNTADTVVNGLVSLVNKFIGHYVITNGLTVGDIINGVNYSYENGLSIKLDSIDPLLTSMTGGFITKALVVGAGRDSIVVKVESITAFTAETDYDAYSKCKDLAYIKSVALDSIEVNYGADISNTLNGDFTLTNDTVLADNSFTVLKTEGYNPTKVGEQTVTVYGFAVKQTEFVFGTVAELINAIPFGMIKTTVKITVREQLDITENSVSVNVNELVGLGTSDAMKAGLGATLSYTYKGNNYTENVDASYISFLTSSKVAIDSITEIGTYYARVNIYSLEMDVPFTVYSTTLPGNFSDDTFTLDTDISSIISKYSYSYLNDLGETITKNFTMEDVIVTSTAASNDNILDRNNIIPSGTETAFVKFTMTINGDSKTVTITTGKIGYPVYGVRITKTYDTVYGGGSTINSTFASIDIYGSEGVVKRTLLPRLSDEGKFYLRHAATSTNYDVSSVKIFDGENDITATIYDPTTGKINTLAGFGYEDNKTLRVEVSFTTPDGADEYANHTYTFSSEFTFQNLDKSLKVAISSVKDSTLLNGMLTMDRMSDGLKSTATLTYATDKYVMSYWGSTFGDVAITVANADGEDVTSTVLVDGKFTPVTADTKYTVTFAFTAAEGSGLTSETVTQEITVTPSVFEPTLTLDGTPQLYYGEVFSLPLIYMDKDGVKHSISVKFKEKVMVDLDLSGKTEGIFEYKKFVLVVEEKDGDKFFTDGTMAPSGYYASPIFATVTVEDIVPKVLAADYSIDPDTGIVTKSPDAPGMGANIKINVTIHGKDFSLEAKSVGASDRK